MSVHLLDFWDPEDEHSPTMVLRYFYLDAEAQLAALELRRAGIPSFITHANSQTILPVGQGWIGLHIRRADFEQAVFRLQAADMWEEPVSDHDPHISYYQIIIIITISLIAILLVSLWLLK